MSILKAILKKNSQINPILKVQVVVKNMFNLVHPLLLELSEAWWKYTQSTN